MGADPALDEAVVHGERWAEVGLPCGVSMLWQLCQCEREVGQEFPRMDPASSPKIYSFCRSSGLRAGAIQVITVARLFSL